MRTNYYLDESGNLKGHATIYSKFEKGPSTEFNFDYDTLPDWYPCNFQYDLYTNTKINDVYLSRNGKYSKGYEDPAYKEIGDTQRAKELPKLSNNVIECVKKANSNLKFWSQEYSIITWLDDPSSYTMGDVMSSIKTINSEIDYILDGAYISQGFLDVLPTYTHGEGVMLLYSLITGDRFKGYPLGISEGTSGKNVVLSKETEFKIYQLQSLYNMLQECRKVKKVFL